MENFPNYSLGLLSYEGKRFFGYDKRTPRLYLSKWYNLCSDLIWRRECEDIAPSPEIECLHVKNMFYKFSMFFFYIRRIEFQIDSPILVYKTVIFI